MKAPAAWTPDCQGKQDYDGEWLAVSTRYWPGPEGGGAMTYDTKTGEFGNAAYGDQPSASSQILLRFNAGGGFADYAVWRAKKFAAPTEADVKDQVETWVQKQFDDLRALLDIEPK